MSIGSTLQTRMQWTARDASLFLGETKAWAHAIGPMDASRVPFLPLLRGSRRPAPLDGRNKCCAGSCLHVNRYKLSVDSRNREKNRAASDGTAREPCGPSVQVGCAVVVVRLAHRDAKGPTHHLDYLFLLYSNIFRAN